MITNPFFTTSAEHEQNHNPIHVLIVDDQKFIRARIKEILSTSSDLEIVGMAGDGDQAISMTKSLQPDIVLMDIEMPKINGIEVTKIISQKFSKTKILVLSTHEKEEYIRKIITAGADGYILKQTPPIEFLTAIYAVHRGYSHFGPDILKKIKPVIDSPTDTNKNLDLNKVKSKPSIHQDCCKLISDPGAKTATEGVNLDKLSNPPPENDSKLPVVEVEEFLPPIEKWLTWGGLCVMITLIAILPLSSILKYKTKVRSSATIRPQGEVRLVQAKTEGPIAKILLKPGAEVLKGDIIAEIDPSRLMTRKRQLGKAIAQQKLQLAQLNSQIASIDNQIIAETERNSSEIRAAEANLLASTRTYQDRNVEVNSQVEEAEANLIAAQATLQASENRLVRYRNAANEGALSKEQLAEVELEIKTQQQEIAAANARLTTVRATKNPSNAEVDVARQNVEQAKKSGQASIAGLVQQKETIVRQRTTVNQQLEQDDEELRQTKIDLEGTIIKATAPGEISQLNLRNPGQTVAIGQEIAQIIPNDAALEVKLLTSPQDIGKLELKQRVQMRVSACPYPDYGVLEGSIERIAQDTSQPNNGNGANGRTVTQQQANPFYEIIVKPKAKLFGRSENMCQLKPGMDGSAEIITREETVMKFILRKARLISNM